MSELECKGLYTRVLPHRPSFPLGKGNVLLSKNPIAVDPIRWHPLWVGYPIYKAGFVKAGSRLKPPPPHSFTLRQFFFVRMQAWLAISFLSFPPRVSLFFFCISETRVSNHKITRHILARTSLSRAIWSKTQLLSQYCES